MAKSCRDERKHRIFFSHSTFYNSLAERMYQLLRFALMTNVTMPIWCIRIYLLIDRWWIYVFICRVGAEGWIIVFHIWHKAITDVLIVYHLLISQRIKNNVFFRHYDVGYSLNRMYYKIIQLMNFLTYITVEHVSV